MMKGFINHGKGVGEMASHNTKKAKIIEGSISGNITFKI